MRMTCSVMRKALRTPSRVPDISYEFSQNLAVMSSRRVFKSMARRVEKSRYLTNVGYVRLPRPDSGLDFSLVQAKVFDPLKVCLSRSKAVRVTAVSSADD